jgi:hypothetical protein
MARDTSGRVADGNRPMSQGPGRSPHGGDAGPSIGVCLSVLGVIVGGLSGRKRVTVHGSGMTNVQNAPSAEVASRLLRSIRPKRATTSLAASVDPTEAIWGEASNVPSLRDSCVSRREVGGLGRLKWAPRFAAPGRRHSRRWLIRSPPTRSRTRPYPVSSEVEWRVSDSGPVLCTRYPPPVNADIFGYM